MKLGLQHHSTSQSQQIISVLVLTSILCFSSLILLEPAVAAPISIYSAQILISQGDRPNQLPPEVANAVRRNLSQKVKIPLAQLKITDYSQETWSDGCLGLPQPDELCTQALVEGWRVTLAHGPQAWVYRTDRTGRVVRSED